jgi:hypothetical protein
MSCDEVLKTRISPELKRQAKAIAEREFLSEAAWLKRLVVREIRACDGTNDERCESRRADGERRPHRAAPGSGACTRPLFVRLRSDDRLLLDARAVGRGLRPATYASVLLRAHLRQLTPLPKEELLALKRSTGELAAIGRNINQIAKVANEGGRLPASVRDEFRAMLKICEALRDHTKGLLKANETSWSTGNARARP